MVPLPRPRPHGTQPPRVSSTARKGKESRNASCIHTCAALHLGRPFPYVCVGLKSKQHRQAREDSRSTATFTLTLPAFWTGPVPVNACAYTTRAQLQAAHELVYLASAEARVLQTAPASRRLPRSLLPRALITHKKKLTAETIWRPAALREREFKWALKCTQQS